ncbi:MAG: glucosylglycerol 3-phosphatase [Jaaginema sp. PMC 1079.18]|nr:glucosylglycerol 3-phosphatase [Jaaginema sp. PMC 1080.18]MEC4851916.1 glucosylglycerol 3-phosphatase [Jaaginema sp. PMC 1079.18]MEC4867458.1 glucosylglycerol 3-phosphatase [Jaaginema sp. PMC 1078.18]
MSATINHSLHNAHLSLNHDELAQVLTNTENLLIIQDLDGVCMGLVKDPLTRVINPDYVKATQAFDNHFFVLTNGEHIGKRGVNGIIERAFGDRATVVQNNNYLPGLAAGGVQWQNRAGEVSHPGVSEAELNFLEAVPDRFRSAFRNFFSKHEGILDPETLNRCIESSVLDNIASPTANLNTFYEVLASHHIGTYRNLQLNIQAFTTELLHDAERQGLGDSFFVHYAPNLGRNAEEHEVLLPASDNDSGTTDFQFMLGGAIKEAGVLALLNRYYYHRTGTYPLGEDFSVRQAPKSHAELLDLVENNFDPAQMPLIVGVGDTVNSYVDNRNGELEIRRGGSDRNFLHLIQEIGKITHTGNIVVYIDSSGGEVKNRKPLKLSHNEPSTVLEGPGDPRDTSDPLVLNVAFPGGYQEYTDFFIAIASRKKAVGLGQ